MNKETIWGLCYIFYNQVHATKRSNMLLKMTGQEEPEPSAQVPRD